MWRNSDHFGPNGLEVQIMIRQLTNVTAGIRSENTSQEYEYSSLSLSDEIG